ncbi:MAG: hypothetical protein JRJ29_10105 [Deltaproteobacteria bacterium]|nr:hypothetical protein [Deltaproteobacteria bacterium]
MHIYWRIMGELEELGETLVFHDPSVLREYVKWCREKSPSSCPAYKTNPFLSHRVLRQLEEL